MEKAMVIRTERQFEEKALNDAVKGLAKAFTNIDKNRKDACIIMWRLEDGKKYIKDGFKSLQEFAETIGIDKSTAHKMADAGRVYDSKVPAIAQFAEQAGYTIASKVASMVKDEEQEKKLTEAIVDGSINAEMTVDKINSWKTEATKSNSVKVLPNWKLSGECARVCRNETDVWYEYVPIEIESIGLEKPEDYASEFYTDSIVTSMKNGDNKLYVAVAPDGSMFKYTAEKIKKEKKAEAKVKSIKDYSLEELEELLKLKRAEQQ